MNEEQQLKLQAFLDGELREEEARAVAARLAGDADATALLRELRHTRQALNGFEPVCKLPESREFYWSKIQREIQRQAPVPEPARQTVSIFRLLRRVLVPAVAVAALALVMVGGLRLGFWKSGGVLEAKMTSADTGAFTYEDYAHGTTLVWMSYPAESGFAQKTGH